MSCSSSNGDGGASAAEELLLLEPSSAPPCGGGGGSSVVSLGRSELKISSSSALHSLSKASDTKSCSLDSFFEGRSRRKTFTAASASLAANSCFVQARTHATARRSRGLSTAGGVVSMASTSLAATGTGKSEAKAVMNQGAANSVTGSPMPPTSSLSEKCCLISGGSSSWRCESLAVRASIPSA